MAPLARALQEHSNLQRSLLLLLLLLLLAPPQLEPPQSLSGLVLGSVLDEAAQLTAQVQGGHHAFVGKAINDFAVLTELLNEDTQEIWSVDPYDGPRVDVLVVHDLSSPRGPDTAGGPGRRHEHAGLGTCHEQGGEDLLGA